jgi:hypothetical protein
MEVEVVKYFWLEMQELPLHLPLPVPLPLPLPLR